MSSAFQDLSVFYVSVPFKETQPYLTRARKRLLQIEQKCGTDVESAMIELVARQPSAAKLRSAAMLLDAARGTIFDTPEAGQYAAWLASGVRTNDKERQYWDSFHIMTTDSQDVLTRFDDTTSDGSLDTLSRNRHHSAESFAKLQRYEYSDNTILFGNPAFKLVWSTDGDGTIYSEGRQVASYSLATSPCLDLSILNALVEDGDAASLREYLVGNPFLTRMLLMKIIHRYNNTNVDETLRLTVGDSLNLLNDATEFLSGFIYAARHKSKAWGTRGIFEMVVQNQGTTCSQLLQSFDPSMTNITEHYASEILWEIIKDESDIPPFETLAAAASTQELKEAK